MGRAEKGEKKKDGEHRESSILVGEHKEDTKPSRETQHRQKRRTTLYEFCAYAT